MRPRRLTSIALVAILAAGCSNAGSDRILSITAVGIVKGTVFFDQDGDRTFEPLIDGNVSGVAIRLLTRGPRDTVARATTAADGSYRFINVPVGSYTVVVNFVAVRDTELLDSGSIDVAVAPEDSVSFVVGVTYPHRTIAEARALAPGRKIFLEGVALNARATFSDTTVHLVDTSGFIRMTQVRLTVPTINTADSLRLVGTTARRAGQPTLDNVTPVVLFTSTFLPPVALLGTLDAGAASGGLYDAALIQVQSATVNDTVRVAGDMKLTVNDGTGDLEVLLDKTADAGFLPATGPSPPPYVYVPGNTFDIVGVLVPTGVAGVWRLKPRSTTDLVQR